MHELLHRRPVHVFEVGAAEDVRKVNTDGRTPMFAACANGNLEIAQWLFDHGAADNVRTADGKNSTPMHAACKNGSYEVARWLFGAGGAEDVITANLFGSTPMSVACQYGRLQIAQWLYHSGAAKDVRKKNRTGQTPMWLACSNGHLKVAQWLLNHGAVEDLLTVDEECGRPPMFEACSYGHLEVAQWLVLNGATNNLAGHVDGSLIRDYCQPLLSLIKIGFRRVLSENNVDPKDFQSSMGKLLGDHNNFTGLFLPAMYNLPPMPMLAPLSRSQKRQTRFFFSPCQLPKLRGFESSAVAYIAEFVGVVRGRQLRNLREAYSFFVEYCAETSHEEF